MSAEYQYAENLNQARSLARNTPNNPVSTVKKVAQAASLMLYFNPFMDWLFGIALALALLKDILDFTMIGSLPVIGTVVTLMASLTIALIMFVTGSAQKIKVTKRGKKYIVLIGGTLIEMLFGLNFVPVETFAVIVIFIMTLKQRKEAAEVEKTSA